MDGLRVKPGSRPIQNTICYPVLNVNARNIWIAVIAVFCATLLFSGPHYLGVRSPILFAVVLVIVFIASRFLPSEKEK
jgi:hypothetical protein